MKKIVSLLLALACLASLIVVPASAAGLDQETIQKAIVETAMAYYLKGMKVQYDSQSMTHEHRVYGGSRMSTTDSPEEAADDYTRFTVCSDFTWSVYWDAFRFDSTGGKGGRQAFSYTYAFQMPKSDPTVLLKFSEKKDDYHTRDRAEFIKKVQEMWQPGDIISGYGSKGHAMMYAGDIDGDGRGDIIHSSGSKVNFETGVDDFDNPWKDEKLGFEVGSVRYQDAYEHLCDPDTATKALASAAGKMYSSHNFWGTRFTDIALIRPSLSPNFPKEMPPATESRLKYPRLDIDRSSNLHKYLSTKTGDEITITVTLKNYSDVAMTGIPVTETVPQGATIVEGSANNGGVISANGVSWTVAELPAMGEVKLSYKVKVTAARGATVSLPGGKVDQIPTRDLSYIVSGKPLANTAALTAVANGTNDYGITKTVATETGFANAFYESVLGIDLGIPAKMQDILDALFTVVDVEKSETTGNKLLSPKPVDQLDETGKYLHSMFVPEHLSGKSVKGELYENSMKIQDRTMEYQEGAYEPGDIFLCMQGSSYLKVENPSDVMVYIYLGNGKVAASDGKNVKIVNFKDSVACLLRMNVSMALRPSLVHGDINASAVSFKFTDVKTSAWYYSYVSSLVAKKVINGMNETTFAPNGNLTYGQALKLITLAVGEKEQAAANGHWAGGYLNAAKTKGWIAGDVDLEANINRLQFCQIAAKAAGISQKPEKNPFTDTADASVLALYNAGVVNGMTVTTFQPDGLLTRAQISKIIWCLQAL